MLEIDQTNRILSTTILHLKDEYKSVDRFVLWEHEIHSKVTTFEQQNKYNFSTDEMQITLIEIKRIFVVVGGVGVGSE